jgi:two-component system, LytTR family, response regulator LytT
MTNTKKILIIEDEEANAQRLVRIILNLRPNYRILEIVSSIKKSVEWLSNNNAPDLIFMDIQLSDGVSFEIFNLAEVLCPVIFTTAYDEYALKAFKYNSIDYLLKPVEKEELENAIIKFERLATPSLKQNNLIKNLIDFIDKKEYRKRFLVQYRDGFKQVNVDSVSFFFSELGSTFAISYDGEKNQIPQSLELLEQQLDPKQFFRANRQYIIHINSIKQVHTYFNSKLKLDLKKCNHKVIVSRLKASSFKDWMDY